MKKILSILLCTAMLLCLPACKDTDEAVPTTTQTIPATTAESMLPEETLPQVDLPDIPVAAVTLTPTTEDPPGEGFPREAWIQRWLRV